MIKFYLGTHVPNWLWRLEVPLFISRRTLGRYKKIRQATCDWALDSGGFSELSLYGKWETSVNHYVDEVSRFLEAGRLDFVAPQDWMCEPKVLARTGLTVKEHQKRTTGNFLELRERLGSLVIPVLQGWVKDDYLNHAEEYLAAGVSLADEHRVGIGTVCRRQGTKEITEILETFTARYRLHAFGVKTKGLRNMTSKLASADSLAWSYAARRLKFLSPECVGGGHKNCANCSVFALAWRKRLLEKVSS